MRIRLIYTARDLDGRWAYAAVPIDIFYAEDQEALRFARKQARYELERLIGEDRINQFQFIRVERTGPNGEVLDAQ